MFSHFFIKIDQGIFGGVNHFFKRINIVHINVVGCNEFTEIKVENNATF